MEVVPHEKDAFLKRRKHTMSMILYLVGSAFVIGGVLWALVSAGVATKYVIITGIILVGVAILTGVTRTRSRDQS